MTTGREEERGVPLNSDHNQRSGEEEAILELEGVEELEEPETNTYHLSSE